MNEEKTPFWNRRTQTVAVMLCFVAFMAHTNHGWMGLPMILLALGLAFTVIAPMVNGDEKP